MPKVDRRAYVLPTVSSGLVFGRDHPVYLIQKSSISNNFEQELVRSCSLAIREKGPKELPHEPIFVFHLIIFKFEVEFRIEWLLLSKVDRKAYFFPIFSNVLVFGTDSPM